MSPGLVQAAGKEHQAAFKFTSNLIIHLETFMVFCGHLQKSPTYKSPGPRWPWDCRDVLEP